MIRAFLLAMFIGLAAVPAAADQVTYSWAPREGRETRLLQGAFALHALRQRVRDDARVEQRGQGNSASIAQQGGGNRGLIRQDGDGHSANLDQAGGGNAHAIIQGGKGAQADVAQSGGELGVTLQYGW